MCLLFVDQQHSLGLGGFGFWVGGLCVFYLLTSNTVLGWGVSGFWVGGQCVFFVDQQHSLGLGGFRVSGWGGGNVSSLR